MDQSPRDKLKLLRLYRLLARDSDAQHPISRTQLAQEMINMGYGYQLRVVSDDIELMNRDGFHIEGCYNGHERCFYMGDRVFTTPELRILLDALQGASFISPAKTKTLSEKLASLAGNNLAPLLLEKRSLFTTRKRPNDAILYSVATLNNAIKEEQQVSFCYFDLDENARRVYRKDGARYRAEPLALVFQDDNFYLLTWNSKYGSFCNYRVDRMDRVRPEQELLTDAARRAKAETPPEKYIAQCFHMYNGELTDVTLHVRRAALNRFFDRFGTETHLTPLGEDLFEVTVPLQVSPEFYAWMFRFCGDISIAAPEELAEEFRRMARKAAGIKDPEPEIVETGPEVYLFPPKPPKAPPEAPAAEETQG